MWLSLILGRIAGIWRGLPGSLRGFILGTAVGVTLSNVSCSGWHNRDAQIAIENAKAALDSTRKLSARHDTVYARLIAQKDVRLAGALASVARSQGDKPRAVVTVGVRGRGVDTTVVHRQYGAGDSVRLQRSMPTRQLSDSLVLGGPPVEGNVKATVTDSTWIWSARLRPSKADLNLALTCGKNGPEVLVNGPDWADINIGPGQVAPAVCHPAPSKWFSGFRAGVVVTGSGLLVLRLFGVIH